MSAREMPDNPQPVMLYATPPEVIEGYARLICEGMALLEQDPNFRKPVIVQGMADFFKAVAHAETKRINRQNGAASDAA